MRFNSFDTEELSCKNEPSRADMNPEHYTDEEEKRGTGKTAASLTEMFFSLVALFQTLQ